ncbi:ATP-binding protein [Streptomyces kanamyceticus]|uniref:ATP-binding protein n=1 Tax=Streptomyces kanamyceticus TaxID=1967 RepID=UPI000A91F9A2|nr:ATP-binding protein [Streptomyces kanamyceticus]
MRAHGRAHRLTACVEYALPQEAASARRARKLTSAFLARSHRRRCEVTAERMDDVTLIVSELVANAVQHARGGCRLRVEVAGDRVTVEVYDASPVHPKVRRPNFVRESGRGLAMVRQLAQRLEVVGAPRGGKTVRAILAG